MDQLLNQVFRLRETREDIGIEVEMEGRALPTAFQKYWNVTRDGSLRPNPEAYEYVLAGAVSWDDAELALKHLWQTFDGVSDIRPSDRCGVHIHINVQHETQQDILTFICLYLIVEDLLVKWCGEDREGNMFCLRVRDAEWLCEELYNVVVAGTFGAARLNETIRYASINLAALRKYGSLEFRALPTPKKYDRIVTWIKMIRALKTAAKDFSHPRAIVETLSNEGAERFLSSIFGPLTKELTCQGMDDILYDGVRRIQDVCYFEPYADEAQINQPEEQVLNWEDMVMARPMYDEDFPDEDDGDRDPGWLDEDEDDMPEDEIR